MLKAKYGMFIIRGPTTKPQSYEEHDDIFTMVCIVCFDPNPNPLTPMTGQKLRKNSLRSFYIPSLRQQTATGYMML